MPNKVDSWGLNVSRDAESPLHSPDKLWDLQSLLQRVLQALLLHEAYHLPEHSAKTRMGLSLKIPVFGITPHSETWDFIFLEFTFMFPTQYLH